MTRLEETEWPIGKCPCGKGSVVRHHVSPDHGYGGGSIEDKLNCPKCGNEWTVEGNQLVQNASMAPVLALRKEKEELESELRPIARTAVEAHFAKLNLTHKSAEFAELNRLRLGRGTLAEYRSSRKKRTIQALADAAGNPQWIAENCDEQHKKRASQIAARLKAIPKELAKAEKQIVRVPIG